MLSLPLFFLSPHAAAANPHSAYLLRNLEKVVAGLFHPHTFQLRIPETGRYDAVNLPAEIFRCGHQMLKCSQLIQILVVKPVYDLTVHKSINVGQIHDHTRRRVYGPAEGDFHNIVVAVTVRMIAFAVNLPVFCLAIGRSVQPVRGRQPVTA
jgi:hypothetical protein